MNLNKGVEGHSQIAWLIDERTYIAGSYLIFKELFFSVPSAYEDPKTDVFKGGVSDICSQPAFHSHRPVCRQHEEPLSAQSSSS